MGHQGTYATFQSLKDFGDRRCMKMLKIILVHVKAVKHNESIPMKDFGIGDLVLLQRKPKPFGSKFEAVYDGSFIITKKGLRDTSYFAARKGLPESIVNNHD